ncbi:MAG TPA: class I SAM-dependent methyltransferase [Candidatus Marinimicrobia bacterium]|nr:class I SAM-dependent methyltransferase [Candidatus Neomarinimicrobiota bacterium]
MRKTYGYLAEVYDTLMADVDYQGWGEYIEDITLQWRPLPMNIADISCGTGRLLHELQSQGRRLAGMDISLEMIKKAKEKYPGIHFFQGDMNHIPLSNRFDLIVNIHDALNYLQDFNAVKAHFLRMADYLQAGQLYLFDFAMLPVVEKYFQGTEEWNYLENGWYYHRWHKFQLDQRLHQTYIAVYGPDESEPRIIECHEQYIYSYSELQKIFGAIPNCYWKFYEEFTFDQANEETERLFGVMSYDRIS